MTKIRFTQWIVLACIGTLASCTSGGDTAGNTELNVLIPNGNGNGSSAPAAFDIQVVEYTIACLNPDPVVLPPEINSAPAVATDTTFSGVLEVLDTAGPGVPAPDFGPALTETYVWQGFMDLPPGTCTVQLRARDADGEVICTATTTFVVAPDDTVKVDVLMICDISFQFPVGMMDLDGSFQFNVSNYCPSAYVLNCIDTDIDIQVFPPPIGAVAATACQTRFEDHDSTCGTSCDPQCCVVTSEGLDCTQPGGPALAPPCDAPGPDPGVSTTVTCVGAVPFACAIPGPLFGTPCVPAAGDTCFDLSAGAACVPSAVIDCTGTGTPEASCTFNGDTLGNIGDGPPGPFAPGIGGFFVACVLADDDGNPLTPDVPVAPGQDVWCTATTTDGDLDCDKVKEVHLTCPGLTPCQAFIAGGGTCDDGTICTADSCDDNTCDGATAAACCVNAPTNEGADCSAENPPLASCQSGVCTTDACTADVDCDDGNECTAIFAGICDTGTGICAPSNPVAATTPCAGNTGECDGAGTCVDNCTGVVCDDGNECTDDPACVSLAGPICPPPVNNDANSCTTCPGIGGAPCECSAGACIDGLLCPPAPILGAAQTACRNSFNQAVSQFPVNMTIDFTTHNDCVFAGTAFDLDVTPTLFFDLAFLNIAVSTLCTLGIDLTAADIQNTFVEVDASSGHPPSSNNATCTSTTSGPVNGIFPLDVVPPATVPNPCPGTPRTVASPLPIPMPAVVLPCSAAGAAPGPVGVCAVGATPANAVAGAAAVDTWAEVSIGFPANVSFQCGDGVGSTPILCPGGDPDCAAIIGNEGTVSTCDLVAVPNDCVVVPLDLNPLVDCVSVPIEP